MDKLHNSNTNIPNMTPATVFPESSYSLSAGTVDYYNIAILSIDASGNTITSYYKININMDAIGNGHYIWKENSSYSNLLDTITVKLPNDENKYFYYTYKDNGATLIEANYNLNITDTVDGDGFGIQRTINDRLTAYGQIMLRHGGRNGIAANFGGRYMLGEESNPNANKHEL